VKAFPLRSAPMPVRRLREALAGQVIAAGDETYDDARAVFYRAYDRHPAAIVRPVDAAEVARVVGLARDSGLELAVRSGGHSLAGHGVSEGGIVLDLSAMKGLAVDTEQRTAWAQAGLTAGEYVTAVASNGLTTGFGDTPSVGIGGVTLGGGIGYLVRKYGLTVDDLLAAEVVTADGEVLRVDGRSHPDLFWAIRGGGGNFGVVTRFQFRLRPVDTVVGGQLILPATPAVIAGYVELAEAAPEELSTIANMMVAPPMPDLPTEAHGQLVLMGLMVYAGDVEAGERAVAPFRALATPIADMVAPMPYPEIYRFTADTPEPPQEVARSMFLDQAGAETAEAIVTHLRAATAPLAVAQLRALGGAMARVPADATAFAHRNRRFLAALGAVYEQAEETPVHQAWATRFAADLGRGAAPGVYVGFLGDEGSARVHEAYPGPTWERLAAVKRRYDPTNLFHLNQNVPPAD
jgi:FAD/FMN-containing dehydrogenase